MHVWYVCQTILHILLYLCAQLAQTYFHRCVTQLEKGELKHKETISCDILTESKDSQFLNCASLSE